MKTRLKTSNRKREPGFSLIEIMVSILILAALALGGGAAMYQTGGGIQRQQNKREAIVAANGVLESYWNKTYADLESEVGSFSKTVLVNGNNMPLSGDIATGTDSDAIEYLEIQVSIAYMPGDTVELVSRRYERGLSKAR